MNSLIFTLSAARFLSAEDKKDQGAWQQGCKQSSLLPSSGLKLENWSPYRSLVHCFRTLVTPPSICVFVFCVSLPAEARRSKLFVECVFVLYPREVLIGGYFLVSRLLRQLHRKVGRPKGPIILKMFWLDGFHFGLTTFRFFCFQGADIFLINYPEDILLF